MNVKRAHFVAVGGPPIPIVPVGDFDRLPHSMLKDAWWLIGPSVSRNIERCAIWEVIAAAYLEGMNHGYEMSQQQKGALKMENEAQIEMPVYKCHKEVWALRIKDVMYGDTGEDVIITPEEKGYAPFNVSYEYAKKHNPQIGGYYVVYKDGYKSFSPAEAFEDGYSRV